jgi:drug/metabolite transporter (DMT)-like permease
MSIPAISWWSIAYLYYRIYIVFIAYIYMLQNLPAEINSIYAYINPIVAVLLGALIFGELTMVIAIGVE